MRASRRIRTREIYRGNRLTQAGSLLMSRPKTRLEIETTQDDLVRWGCSPAPRSPARLLIHGSKLAKIYLQKQSYFIIARQHHPVAPPIAMGRHRGTLVGPTTCGGGSTPWIVARSGVRERWNKGGGGSKFDWKSLLDDAAWSRRLTPRIRSSQPGVLRRNAHPPASNNCASFF